MTPISACSVADASGYASKNRAKESSALPTVGSIGWSPRLGMNLWAGPVARIVVSASPFALLVL